MLPSHLCMYTVQKLNCENYVWFFIVLFYSIDFWSTLSLCRIPKMKICRVNKCRKGRTETYLNMRLSFTSPDRSIAEQMYIIVILFLLAFIQTHSSNNSIGSSLRWAAHQAFFLILTKPCIYRRKIRWPLILQELKIIFNMLRLPLVTRIRHI